MSCLQDYKRFYAKDKGCAIAGFIVTMCILASLIYWVIYANDKDNAGQLAADDDATNNFGIAKVVTVDPHFNGITVQLIDPPRNSRCWISSMDLSFQVNDRVGIWYGVTTCGWQQISTSYSRTKVIVPLIFLIFFSIGSLFSWNVIIRYCSAIENVQVGLIAAHGIPIAIVKPENAPGGIDTSGEDYPSRTSNPEPLS